METNYSKYQVVVCYACFEHLDIKYTYTIILVQLITVYIATEMNMNEWSAKYHWGVIKTYIFCSQWHSYHDVISSQFQVKLEGHLTISKFDV